jgi:hypothetical protein
MLPSPGEGRETSTVRSFRKYKSQSLDPTDVSFSSLVDENRSIF